MRTLSAQPQYDAQPQHRKANPHVWIATNAANYIVIQRDGMNPCVSGAVWQAQTVEYTATLSVMISRNGLSE